MHKFHAAAICCAGLIPGATGLLVTSSAPNETGSGAGSMTDIAGSTSVAGCVASPGSYPRRSNDVVPSGSSSLTFHSNGTASPLVILTGNVPETAASAANWYVDNLVASSGDGTSWATAWKNFSDIDWTKVKGGDTLFISGGFTSQTYFETLTIGASGTAGKPITITRGIDSGHNGTVIIDEKNVYNTNGVYAYGKNYFTIQNLQIRNVGNAGISIKSATAGVLLQNNCVYPGFGFADPNNPNNGGDARGYDVRDSSGVTVRNNYYETPTTGTNYVDHDGIWTSNDNGVVIEGNTIRMQSSNDSGHDDCIQSYHDISVTYRNNYCSVTPYIPNSNNHGFWLQATKTGGVLYVYNNIVSMAGDAYSIAHANDTGELGYVGSANIYNNTVYGGWSFELENTPNTQLKNNIAWPESGGYGVVIKNASIPASNIDHNLVWAPNANISAVYNADGFSSWTVLNWSQWRALGYDAHGLNADPKLTNPANQNFALQSTSPAIGKAATLSQVTTDIIGTPRPPGGYDIGAYEYIARPVND
jgi:Right handed beta helix region